MFHLKVIQAAWLSIGNDVPHHVMPVNINNSLHWQPQLLDTITQSDQQNLTTHPHSLVEHIYHATRLINEHNAPSYSIHGVRFEHFDRCALKKINPRAYLVRADWVLLKLFESAILVLISHIHPIFLKRTSHPLSSTPSTINHEPGHKRKL